MWFHKEKGKPPFLFKYLPLSLVHFLALEYWAIFICPLLSFCNNFCNWAFEFDSMQSFLCSKFTLFKTPDFSKNVDKFWSILICHQFFWLGLFFHFLQVKSVEYMFYKLRYNFKLASNCSSFRLEYDRAIVVIRHPINQYMSAMNHYHSKSHTQSKDITHRCCSTLKHFQPMH